MEFRNESGNEFTDISSEQFREYNFATGLRVKIKQPLYLAVSDNGHRLFDASGISHYVALNGEFHLQWKAKDGEPHFVK